MTWCKLGDEFPAAARDLTDAEYRMHVDALCWSALRLLDLHIPKAEVRRFAESPDAEAAVKGLAVKGWWEDLGDTWYIGLKFPEWQLERVVAEKRREDDALRQRRRRMHKAGDHSLCLAGHCAAVTRDEMRDVTRDVTRAQGRDGSGPTDPPVPELQNRNQDQGQDQEASVGAANGQRETVAGPARLEHSAANSEDHRVHDGPDSSGSDDQQIPLAVHLQSPAADRNAREGDRPSGTRPATLQRQEARKQRVAAFIADRPGCNGNELQAAIGGHRSNMLTSIRELIDEGVITRIRDTEDRRVCRYLPNGEHP